MIATTAIEAVTIPVGKDRLDAHLRVPANASALVIVADATASSRFSAPSRYVAELFDREGLATLVLDLLTNAEEAVDMYTARYRFDVQRLGRRLSAAVDWASLRDDLRELPVGCFGTSTGAAAALIAAADRPVSVAAVVSRGGRPDLAGEALWRVQVPTLLIVGSHDEEGIRLNREAMRPMGAHAYLEIVPGASHSFEEPGTLDRAAHLATGWFACHLGSAPMAMVPVEDWGTFLARFSRQHRGWLTTVERIEPRGILTLEAAARPLEAIVPVVYPDRPWGIEVRFRDAAGPGSVLIPHPTALRVDEPAAGAERGVDIESEDGVLTRVRFRATVRADALDGVAANEL